MTVTPEGYLAIAYGVLGPGAWAFFLFVAIKGRARLALRKPGTPLPEPPPKVSLIVPCHNEAAGIAECLNSAVAQDYPALQVIAVDDRSTDGTGAVIDRLAADGRLTALHVRDGELPPGWLGKPNAVCRGVAAADGQWLVFIDSDCTLAPSAVREAIATGTNRNFGLVSWVPRFVGSGFWDSLLTPLCGMATGGMYSMIWANAHHRPQTAFACGQFIAVRRDAYDAVGGHAALHDSAGEDVEMARRLKRAGFAPRLGWGMDLVTTRMYSDLAGIFNGWGRNFIAASRGSTRRVWGAIAVLFVCTFTALPVLAYGLWHVGTFEGNVWLTLGVLHYAAVTLNLIDGYRWGRARAAYALLWPLGLVLLLAVFVRSLYFSKRRQVVWRGVRYDLAKAPTGTAA
jgi:glycosyltransferase involved in cell wall biosynthesis